jgi:hypothetical protein
MMLRIRGGTLPVPPAPKLADGRLTVSPNPSESAPVIAWSYNLPASPRGFCLAREKRWLLVWDDRNALCLLDGAGRLQAQRLFSGKLTAACCADDGSALAAVGSRGEVWWLAPDLTSVWERKLPAPAQAAALESFGQYLAVADARGGLHIFDRQGRPMTQVESPRPFQHLAFVPAGIYVAASADFGLVACIDLQGRWAWRDGLVMHVGALAVAGNDGGVILACYTEGLQRYALSGERRTPFSTVEPWQRVAASFDGRVLVAAGLSKRLHVLEGDGRLRCTYALDAPPTALAVAALGDQAFVALPDARILALDIRPVGR